MSKALHPYVPYVVKKWSQRTIHPQTFSPTTHTNLAVPPQNLLPPLPPKNIMAKLHLDPSDLILLENILNDFKKQLLSEFKSELQNFNGTTKSQTKWLKSHQVQRLLGISPGTLQTLRINRTIPYSKIGGTIFYNEEEIMNVLKSRGR